MYGETPPIMKNFLRQHETNSWDGLSDFLDRSQWVLPCVDALGQRAEASPEAES
jgi:hypothetical protein